MTPPRHGHIIRHSTPYRLYLLEGKEFVKHSAVHAAVHRDLVKSGRWLSEIGKDYSRLLRLRETGDYGGGRHVQEPEARDAIAAVKQIRDAVIQAHPELSNPGK